MRDELLANLSIRQAGKYPDGGQVLSNLEAIKALLALLRVSKAVHAEVKPTWQQCRKRLGDTSYERSVLLGYNFVLSSAADFITFQLPVLRAPAFKHSMNRLIWISSHPPSSPSNGNPNLPRCWPCEDKACKNCFEMNRVLNHIHNADSVRIVAHIKERRWPHRWSDSWDIERNIRCRMSNDLLLNVQLRQASDVGGGWKIIFKVVGLLGRFQWSSFVT